jgi:Double zinc ribbon
LPGYELEEDMTTDKDLPETDLHRAEHSKTCPICHTPACSNDRICHTCGVDLSIRVCPVCLKTIPADEDPCHYCGHLEPAIPPESTGFDYPRSNAVDKSLFITFLVLALAMIIWPRANQPSPSTCLHDEEISCFFETSWGVSGGIYLITFCMLSLILSAISSRLRHRG